MIRSYLEIFITTTMQAGEITLADVQSLHRKILPNGIEHRDEADVLIALDRAVADKHIAWAAFMVPTVTDFVVWLSRPTGTVDGETARWLVGSLSAGRGPSPLADAIAFEVVREAESCDAVLTAFAMRSARGRFCHVGLGVASPAEA